MHVLGDDPRIDADGAPLPRVSASASVKDGVALVSLSNLHLDEPTEIVLDLRGRSVGGAAGRVLAPEEIAAHNAPGHSDAVAPVDLALGAIEDGRLTVTLPPHSFATVSLTLA